jgi:DNA polymerase-1
MNIKVDTENLHKAQIQLRSDLETAERALNEAVGRPLNALSSQQCAAYFYGELGYAPYYSKKNKDGTGGGVTTDDKALQRLVRKGCRQAKLVQEVRGLTKLISNYIEVQYDADGRFRSSYNPRGTVNGRLSSSKTVFGTGYNAQNLDPIFKQYLIADEDHVLIEVDKRQAEWVVMAYLTNDAGMLQAVRTGQDIHIATAARMYSVPPEIVKHDHKIVGSESDSDLIADLRRRDEILSEVMRITELPRSMSLRQAGKKSNHGLNYDEGYRTFSLTNELPENEGKRLVEGYHRIYPGIRQWYERIKQQLATNRTLVNTFGRPRIFLGAMNDDLFKSAYAFLPQSTVVDGLNQGMLGMYNECRPVKLLAQVHDSVLFEVHRSEIPHLWALMCHIYHLCEPEMEYSGHTFKIATDMKIGLNWRKASKTNPLGMAEIKNNPGEASPEQFNAEIEGIIRGWETH